MPEYPTYRIGEAFPADQRNAAFMQLLMTTRQWMVLSRALVQMDSLPKEVRNEQFLHLFLLGVAAGKEAADAFRECDRLKLFEGLPVAPLKNASDPLALARRECDSDNPEALFKSALVRARSNAGFHWSRKLLQQALSDVAELEVHAAKGGTTNFDSAIPVAEILGAEVLRSQGLPPGELPDIFPRISALLDSLRQVADTALALLAYNATTTGD